MSKKEYIERVIEDLEENFYDSRKFIMGCVEKYLNSMSLKDLRDFYEVPE